MDLYGALPDEIILEVYDEEWVQAVDYEHVPFRCRKCHEHRHLFRDCPLSKMESSIKATSRKETESFTKVGGRGKGGRKNQKKIHEEKQPSHNRCKILEEEEGDERMNQVMKDNPVEKEKDGSMEDRTDKI